MTKNMCALPGRDPWCSAAEALLRETGCTVRRWRNDMRSGAWTEDPDWGIEVPEPRGPISFGTFAAAAGLQLAARGGRRPKWKRAIDCEQYALDQFDRFELPGRDRYERNAAEAVAWRFIKAMMSGVELPTIISGAPPWANDAFEKRLLKHAFGNMKPPEWLVRTAPEWLEHQGVLPGASRSAPTDPKTMLASRSRPSSSVPGWRSRLGGS